MQSVVTLPDPGDLLDEKEVAAILKCGINTLRNWRSLKKGPPFVKVGERLVRYRRADLAAFVTGDTSKAA